MKRKKDLVEEEIMQEMTGIDLQPLNEAIVSVSEPESNEGANEFNDTSEYTIQVIADNGVNIDPTILPKKDPNFEYRFIRDDHKNIAKKTSALLYQMGGWQIVPKEHAVKKCGISEKMLAADGSYRVGELILTFMPKNLYAKKIAEEQRKTNARMEAVKRKLREGDPTVGGAEMHETMVGIQTGKQLKGNSKWD